MGLELAKMVHKRLEKIDHQTELDQTAWHWPAICWIGSIKQWWRRWLNVLIWSGGIRRWRIVTS